MQLINFYVAIQDWLNVEFAGLPSFLNNVNLGNLWLEEMADAAKLWKIPIQYCMSNTRHALKAVQLDIVTQVCCHMSKVQSVEQSKFNRKHFLQDQSLDIAKSKYRVDRTQVSNLCYQRYFKCTASDDVQCMAGGSTC